MIVILYINYKSIEIMKKVIFIVFSVLCSSMLMAQNDCMAFFPTTAGSALITKSYDAKDKLLNTMTYKVNKTYKNVSGSNTNIEFVLADSKGSVIDNGEINAVCNDGNFYLKMENRSLSPTIMDLLASRTELIANFLDYPNRFIEIPFNGIPEMDEAQFTIQSKEDKKNYVSVRVYNRKYERNEKVTTPAGTFNTIKISFDFETIKNKKTTVYKGIEWYAQGAGIVRSETYNNKGVLKNYSVLTTLVNK